MAQPHAATYTLSGGAIYAGRWVGQFAGALPLDASEPSSTLGGVYMPAWVPATAWQWTDIPGSTWTDAVKTDGTGSSGAPQITTNDPGVEKFYASVWDYSGPCYSRKNHEWWHFGGGHAGTTINILTKTALHANSAVVSMVCAPTTEAIRRVRCFDERTNYFALGPYHTDGKPYSPHSYYNNLYLDGPDEFVSFGIAGVASSADGSTMGGPTGQYPDLAVFARGASNWSPANTRAPMAAAPYQRGARVVSADGTKVHWWVEGASSGGMNVYNIATNAHSVVGGTAAAPTSIACNNGADVSLHLGLSSSSGWQVTRCDLSTGVQTTVTVTGDALPAGLSCIGLDYVPELGYYVVVWVNASAYNAGAAVTANNVTQVLVCTLTVSGSSAVATNRTLTGSAPTSCGAYRGVAYDPAYGCLLLNMSPIHPIKAVKLS